MPDRMKKVSRGSISDEFEILDECPIPSTPKCGARIKIHYAGACYTTKQVKNSGQRRLRIPGVHDTSLFPGYEVSGVVDELCSDLIGGDIKKGDRVVVYPDECNESCIQDGTIAEYITTCNVQNLIKVPPSLSLDVACQLPSGALMAHSAVLRVKPFVQMKMEEEGTTNILIVGAGVLSQWTIKLSKHFIGMNANVKTTVADTCLKKLKTAKNCGCCDVIQWDDSIHEESLIERTKDVCRGGADVIIDYVSTPRSISRAMKVLKEDGVLLVGGTSHYEVSFCLSTLAQNNHSIIGVRKGSRKQLADLVDLFSKGEITAPEHTTYPVNDANEVFQDLTQCKIAGRAVLEVCPE